MSRLCVVTSDSTNIRMNVNRNAASTLSYKSRNLKRMEAEPITRDPCDKCLISATCTTWCDEKKEYLWE